MTYKIVVLPEAEADLIRLAAFLSAHSPNAAAKMGERLKSALRSLDEMPSRTPVRDGAHQFFVPFGDAGYVVSYRLEGERVLISRIFHTREDR